MRWTHMSAWDQEEYALGQRTPEMVQHLVQCAACRQGVEQLQQGVQLFRTSAMEWSAECSETHPYGVPAAREAANARGLPASSMPALKWALAALVLLLVLLPLMRFLPKHNVANVTLPVSTAPLSDDALLQEVDQQVSESVPDSMESLTHLVTTKSSADAVNADREGGEHVQRN